MPGHIYHWKHGWIPITPRAAMVKAKGHRGAAARYMHDYHIPDHRQEGRDRRQGGKVDIGDKRQGEHRGTFEYRPGTKTRDYPDRNPHGATGGPGPEHGPKSAGEAFKMKKRELEPHAKAGNPHAQRELDRRAAKRGGSPAPAPKATAPKADRPVTPTKPTPDFRPGHDIPTAAPKVTSIPVNEPESSLTHARTAKHAETMFGTGSERHMKALRAWDDYETKNLGMHAVGHQTESTQVVGGSITHSHYINDEYVGGVRALNDGQSYVAIHKGQYLNSASGSQHFLSRADAHHAIVKEHARLNTPPKAPSGGSLTPAAAADRYGFGSDEHKAVLGANDRDIAAKLAAFPSAGPGHKISTHASLYNNGNLYALHYREGFHSHIGKVTGNDADGYRANWLAYTPLGNHSKAKSRDLGTFKTQEEAHKAIALADTQAQAKRVDAKAKKDAEAARVAAERKAARAAVEAPVLARVGPGPGGHAWESANLDDGGSVLGQIANGRVRQAYKAGNTTVHIEHEMDAETTHNFLANVTAAANKTSPMLGDTQIKFHVPESGDHYFSRKPSVGAYVMYGDRTVNVNPRMADGRQHESFRESAHDGHFMPAGKTGSILEYTLIHELGHVHDGQHRLTRPTSGDFGREGTAAHRAAMRLGHSGYGHKNPAEGYAEAFAQWTLEGKGSHQASDAYAEKFGWTEPPSQLTEDRKILAANKAKMLARAGRSDPAARPAIVRAFDPGNRYGIEAPRRQGMVTDGTNRQVPEPALDPPRRPKTEAEKAKALEELRRFRAGERNPFDSQHSAGLAKADANRTKPLSSTVKSAKEAVATLPPDVYARVMKGRSIDSMSADELRAVLRAVIDYAKSRKG